LGAAQLILDGLALGAAYALTALGFVLILNATGAVNFAQGDLVMAGGYVALGALSFAPVAGAPVPGLILLPLVAALCALGGLALACAAYLPLRRAPPVSVFVSTIAVGIMLRAAANGWFGAAERKVPPLVAGPPIESGALTLDRQSLAMLAAAALLIAALHILLSRTQLGRRLRAAAEDPPIARALGVNVTALILLSFALGTALAGIAGLLVANAHFLTPQDGLNHMLKAYIAVTLGGWGSLRGAVAGAAIVAGFEALVGRWLSASIAELALCGLMLVVLLFFPRGLFGEAAGRRA
jgi:branched-chain amino acid transport system permease protein